MFTLILALVGCGLFTTAEGKWEGTCTSSGYSINAVLDISDDKGGDLTGDFTLSGSGNMLTMSGDGTRDGTSIDMDLPLSQSGYTLDTTFTGEMDGDTLTGTWGYSASGYSASVPCELTRN